MKVSLNIKRVAKLYVPTIFALLLFNNLNALENYPAGARSAALSHASVSFSDVWGTFHNQAGIAGFEKFATGVFYESKFGVDLLSLSAASLILPVGSGSFSFSYFQFGTGYFRENKFAIAYARQLSQKISAGVQLDYFAMVLPENARAKGFPTFEGGILYKPSDKLHLGAHLFNPVRAGMGTPSGKSEMPLILRAGGHYFFSDMVMAAFEMQKDNQNPMLLKTGIEFLPVEKFVIRAGVSGRPFKYTAGIGYKTDGVTADIGFGYHGNLGITPSVSIQINMK